MQKGKQMKLKTHRFRHRLVWAAWAILLPIAALSHSGVQNPAVMTRMHGMSDLAAQTKVLGDMAKGKTTFDAQTAHAATQAIQAEAARIPSLFQPRETDPQSEALPSIWTSFDSFTALAADLQDAAGQDVSTPQALAQTLGAIGQTCAACHKSYRK